jgi:GcrA cell cycle regulator
MGAPRHAEGWTEPRVAQLVKLFNEGKTFSECARLIGGGVTRNACIGKIQRLGLSERKGAGGAPAMNRAALSRLANTPRPAKAPKVEKPKPEARVSPMKKPADVKPGTWNGPAGVPVAPYRPGKVEGDGPPMGLNLIELPASGCKWPVNDGQPEFRFCGHRRFEDRPYCRGHCGGAYSAASSLAKHSPTELARSLRRFL